jgi:hypothetical protein
VAVSEPPCLAWLATSSQKINDQSTPLQRVTLERTLPYDILDSMVAVSFRAQPATVVDSGVEGLTFRFKWSPYAGHHLVRGRGVPLAHRCAVAPRGWPTAATRPCRLRRHVPGTPAPVLHQIQPHPGKRVSVNSAPGTAPAAPRRRRAGMRWSSAACVTAGYVMSAPSTLTTLW